MKKLEIAIKEYVSKLSEDDLQFVHSRCNQLLFNDRPDVLNFMSKHKDMDRILTSIESAEELFDCIDLIGSVTQKEIKRLSA